MLKNELKIDTYYRLIWNLDFDKQEWLFQFKGLHFNHSLKINYYYIDNQIYTETNNVNLLPCYEYDRYEEIIFEDLIIYLPDDHIDKKNYLRKNKIKNLLESEN